MARPTLPNHRKFKRLVQMLDIPAAYVRGHLELLWDSCYESGDELLGDAMDVELAAGWKGQSGELATALLGCGGAGLPGFLELDASGRFIVHDLWDHAPAYVRKRRQREVERKQTGLKLTSQCLVTDQSLTAERRRNGVTDCRTAPFVSTPSPSPSPSPKEEKAVAAAPPPPAAILVFPCVGSGAKEWGLSKDQLVEWQELYPHLDVLANIRKALAHVKADQSRRKTARGMTRFLVAWLTRETDGGRRQPQPNLFRAPENGSRPLTPNEVEVLRNTLVSDLAVLRKGRGEEWYSQAADAAYTAKTDEELEAIRVRELPEEPAQ